MSKITVQNTQIAVVRINECDYISLTDIVRNIEKAKDGQVLESEKYLVQ